MDEEELRAVTIGELVPYRTQVVIADYDPAWPDWFAQDREKDRTRYAAAKRELSKREWR